MPDTASADFLDRLDAVLGCQHCGGPLGESPSDDFCGEDCLTAWHAANTDAPSLPLEFEVPGLWFEFDEPRPGARNYCVNPSCTYDEAGWLRAGQVTWTMSLSRPDTVTVTYDEPYRTADTPEPTAADRAIETRRNRNTGPPASRMDGRRGRGGPRR